MAYIESVSREQILLFPESIDDYLTEDNPVRFIDAFVDNLNLMELGFDKATPADTGRPAYNPQDLLKLYIYGYKNRITSSRRLESETHRNMEVIWLLKKLSPDFKTVSDFRKENKKSFKKVFRQFTILCSRLNLFSGELVAIDGTKIKAVNNLQKNYPKSFLKKRLDEIDKRIDEYLRNIDETDEKEKDIYKPTAEELKEKISSLKKKKKEYKQMVKTMDETGESQISLTDPDSRSYPRKFGVPVGYNAQIAVDEKNHLIVEQDVTNAVTDIDQLSRIAKEAKNILEVENIKVVADAGYCNAKEIKECENAGIEAYTPKINTSNSNKRGLYAKEMFKYDSEKDCYYCPAGKEMPYKFTYLEKKRNKQRTAIYYISQSCDTCEQRHLCTEGKNPRRINRCPDEDAIDRMNTRMQKYPEIIKKRKKIVEHVFGTIKFWNYQNRFLMRGLEKVKGEFSLSALAYNMKRAINIIGVKQMIKALT